MWFLNCNDVKFWWLLLNKITYTNALWQWVIISLFISITITIPNLASMSKTSIDFVRIKHVESYRFTHRANINHIHAILSF